MNIEINGRKFSFDENSPIDISIPLIFNGPQPNAYGVDPATSVACQSGDLIGDTRRGGSCNFEQIALIPHCNGTHTECVGHITNERISIRDCLRDVLVRAVLISVEDEESGSEKVISRKSIEAALSKLKIAAPESGPVALIIRTLPNDDGKLSRQYGEYIPPYFTTEAMRFIVESGFKHVLVDLPSIDRIVDKGRLTNHRIFWNVKDGCKETGPETRVDSTVTELIYVPNEVKDGEYLLNLQIAPFAADASPSRPILLKATMI